MPTVTMMMLHKLPYTKPTSYASFNDCKEFDNINYKNYVKLKSISDVLLYPQGIDLLTALINHQCCRSNIIIFNIRTVT